MNKRSATISSSNTDGSSAKDWGIEGTWFLQQTLDGYEVEELTTAQAAAILRETGQSWRSPRADQ